MKTLAIKMSKLVAEVLVAAAGVFAASQLLLLITR